MRGACVWLIIGLVACKGGGSDVVARPMASIDLESLDFGEVPEGQSLTQTVTISNTGSGSLNLLSVILSEGQRDSWALDYPRGVALSGGSSASIDVTFMPDDPGEIYGAVVHIRTDAPDEPGLFVHATGVSGLSEADEDGDGRTVAQGDCNDGDALVYPGAPERCNGSDDDCDGDVPANESDSDGDGVRVCAGDCADDDSSRGPGFLEICDDLDNDCDGQENDQTDQDGDGLSICDGDCDDAAANAAPGLVEICGDNRDNDCDGAIDSADADADGHDACGDAPDCDDADATAFPRVVDTGGDDANSGTNAERLATLSAAFGSVNTCPIWLSSDTHAGASTTSEVDIRGIDSGAEIDGGGVRALDVVSGSLRDVTVSGGDADVGGGLRINGGSFALHDVTIESNVAIDGAGVAVLDGELAIFGDTTFDGNTASGNGGAIYASNSLVIDGGVTLYEDNEAADGGAVYAAGSTALLSGSRFIDNTATAAGGGLYLFQGGGHLIQNNRFVSNDAIDGGGAALNDVVGGIVSNNRFESNDAEQGGGIWLDAARVSVVNNTLVDNDATDGGAVRHLAGLTAIHNNLAHFSGGNGAFHSDDGTLVGSYNTAFGTAGADWVGPWLTLGADNRTENPGFFNFTDDGDPDNDVLILQPSSPSIDSGSPDPAFDDPDGTRNDRGHTGGPGAN